MVTNKVIYGVFGDGPLKGIKNGDRLYNVEVNSTINLGTYHAIDGNKGTARCPGQQQTCARCFETHSTCPGREVARKCEVEEGPKVEFIAYIKDLWQKIGYSFEQVELDQEVLEDHTSQDGGMFTPKKGHTHDPSKFGRVSVKMIPKDTDNGAVVEFLITSGLPESSEDDISFRANGTVTISNLSM